MKKIAVFFLAIMFILTGCSSGISQADYDAVVAERDEALAQIEILKERLEVLEQNQPLESEVVENTTVTTAPPEENIAD